MDLLNFPRILTSIRKTVNRLVANDSPEVMLTPPQVRRLHKAVSKPVDFIGPKTKSDAAVLKRLQKGPATANVLAIISRLKRPRNAVARLRKRGLDIPVQRRFDASSAFSVRRECVYSLSRRDKALLERWKRDLAPPQDRAASSLRRSQINGKGAAR